VTDDPTLSRRCCALRRFVAAGARLLVMDCELFALDAYF